MTLAFTDDAIDALADIAAQVNSTVENIGARRLQTVMERVLDEISFEAADKGGEHASGSMPPTCAGGSATRQERRSEQVHPVGRCRTGACPRYPTISLLCRLWMAGSRCQARG